MRVNFLKLICMRVLKELPFALLGLCIAYYFYIRYRAHESSLVSMGMWLSFFFIILVIISEGLKVYSNR